MSNEEEFVMCIRKGDYLTIKDTDVVVHTTKPRILGMLNVVNDEYVLDVPSTPTEEMEKAAQESNYRLPHEESESESESESDSDSDSEKSMSMEELIDQIKSARSDILSVQRKLYELQEVDIQLERVQKMLKKLNK